MILSLVESTDQASKYAGSNFYVIREGAILVYIKDLYELADMQPSAAALR